MADDGDKFVGLCDRLLLDRGVGSLSRKPLSVRPTVHIDWYTWRRLTGVRRTGVFDVIGIADSWKYIVRPAHGVHDPVQEVVVVVVLYQCIGSGTG